MASPTGTAQAADPGAVPWLNSPRPPRWRRRLFKVANVLGALLLLVYIFIMGSLMLLLELPKLPVRMLMKLGTQSFGMIVEHAYALPICKLHVTFSRLVQRGWNRRPYHTRYVDIRTEIPLEGGGICFIHAVPCMTDNFSYIIVDASSMLAGIAQHAQDGLPTCAVDPCDALAVVEALELIGERYYAEAGGLRLEAVLCTHRHWDHSGGNHDLIQMAADEAKKEDGPPSVSARSGAATDTSVSRSASMSDHSAVPLTGDGLGQRRSLVHYEHPLRVYGGAKESTPGCTHKLWHGNCFHVGALVLEALASPGHTKGSMMFRLVNGRPQSAAASAQSSAEELPAADVLFTGDTLFSGGCGAQFEGCELDIEHCFATVLATCDSEDALLFPGHEYTFMLLEHRLTDALDEWAGIEAPGQFLALCGAYYVAAHRRSLRDKVPTVPFMLKSERLINPHFDRSLLRHADVVVAMLDAQTGPGVRRLPAASSGQQIQVQATPRPDGTPSEEARVPDDTETPAENADVAPQEKTGCSLSATEASLPTSPPVPARPASPEWKQVQQEESFVTGAAAPAYQFAFLYKQDLEIIRQDLAEERVSGPQAAARLLELEQRLFKLPLLTGGNDTFCSDGVEPWEEDGALSDDGKGNGPVPPPAEARPVLQERETEDQEEHSEEPSWDARWPSEGQVTTALKVLGVLPEVPVGPKAPCADQDLPVSLNRLQRVLRRLHVSEEHMDALQSVLQKDEPSSTQASSLQCSLCCNDGSRQMQALNSDEPAEVLPLRQVLQLLRPTPVQEHGSVQRCFRNLARFLRRLGRDCLETLWPSPSVDSGAAASSSSALQREGSRESQQEGPPPPDPRLDLVAKQRRAVERVFCSHALDKCPLCSCAFHARPAAARQNPIRWQD